MVLVGGGVEGGLGNFPGQDFFFSPLGCA